MTRDEADKIYEDWHDRTYGKEQEDLIDLLVALGLLKLDEPSKSAEAICLREIEACLDSSDFVRVLNSLAFHGCEIARRK